MKEIPKPLPHEYQPYATMYIDLIPDDGKLLPHLQNHLEQTLELVKSISPEKLRFR